MGTSTYVYDYQNRLTQSIANNATSSYTYDHTTARISQTTNATGTTPTTTTTYISKFYSLTATLTTATTTNATSTTYVYMGDTLVSTIDQPLINGTATGTAIISYIHPNHLQSTNIVTDQNKNIIQSLDYLPYGAPRINPKTTSIDSARKYIGQFADQSGLDYLNARYYDATRGQFLSLDPVFLAIGNPTQIQQFTGKDLQSYLSDPQSMNSYSYATNNPINKRDPMGLDSYWNSSGQLVYSDIKTNGQFFETNDNAMLQSNARSMESNRGNLAFFAGKVQTGGTWDYKQSSRDYFFFKGNLVSKEDFGNLNYGYTGAAGGIGTEILVDAAGFIQAKNIGVTNKGISLSNVRGNFDAKNDTPKVIQGAQAYNSSVNSSGASKAFQGVGNASYNVASGPILARLVTLLLAAYKTINTITK